MEMILPEDSGRVAVGVFCCGHRRLDHPVGCGQPYRRLGPADSDSETSPPGGAAGREARRPRRRSAYPTATVHRRRSRFLFAPMRPDVRHRDGNFLLYVRSPWIELNRSIEVRQCKIQFAPQIVYHTTTDIRLEEVRIDLYRVVETYECKIKVTSNPVYIPTLKICERPQFRIEFDSYVEV
jgi:hypothetical protein